MYSRFVFATSLALMTVACSNRHRHQAISPEAGALFARGEATTSGGSLVIDFEEMRELGFLRPDSGAADIRSELLDVAIVMLSTAAAETPDVSRAQMLSRIAVLTAIVRDWSIWPEAQRLGVFVPLPGGLPDPRAALDRAFLVLASRGDPATTGELLRGIAAVDRAMGGARLSTKNGLLCLEDRKLPSELCLKAGPRYFALGTPPALEAFGALEGQRAPAKPVSGPLARLRLDVPGIGKGEVVVEGRSSVHVAARIRPANPALAARLLEAATERLGKMDESLARARVLVGKDLERTKKALLADPEAPDGIKAVASRMTLDSILDPRGEHDRLRKSIKVALDEGTFTAELVVPEAQVRRLSETSAMTSAAAVGILAAIAIPNFIRYGERARDSRASGHAGDAQGPPPPDADHARIAEPARTPALNGE